jgi:hypothetical protein
MKYFALLLCLSGMSHVCKAQAFIDITASDTSLYWFASHDPTSNNGTSHYETDEHFIGHDTIIHGLQYAITYNGLQRQFLRSDSQKVYALDLQDTIDNLLFDFGAQIGDTLRFHGFLLSHSENYFYAIDSVDSVVVHGSLRRRLHVSSDIENTSPTDFYGFTWIEGVGERNFGLHSIFVSDINNGYSFCGQYQYSAYIYTAFPTCYLLTGINDINASSRIHIYPTPTDGILTIDNNSGNKLEKYTMIDDSGMSIYTGNLTDASSHIDMSSLATGIYCLLLYDDKGNVLTQRVVKR